MEKDPDYEIKWWKDWLEADTLERHNMVEKLSLTNSVMGILKTNMEEKLKIHSVAIMLNGFFEDLESALYTKQRLEKKG